MFEINESLDRRADYHEREGLMICVAVTYLMQPGHEEEAIELFATLTQLTHTETGNLYYLVHRSPTEPRRFFIYEQYTDQAALDTHRASPHFVQYATNGLFLILEKREAEIYVPLP
jgi:quinol monooxygenase YgiN